MAQELDVVVIGSGQGGVPLAMEAARQGRTVALVERAEVGGSCINYGCTPTKTMVASARVAYMAGRAADYGVEVGPPAVDMRVVRKRKRDIVQSFRSGMEKQIEDTGNLTLLRGGARFVSDTELLVAGADGNETRLKGRYTVINTGAAPRTPNVQGLDQVPTLDSTSIMELDHVPESLLIVGGGYIGLEFGQMFSRFGSAVTIIHRGPNLLSREDADVASEMRSILENEGIRVLLESTPRRVEPRPGGLAARVETPSGETVLEGSYLMLAAGRVPATDGLGLETTRVRTDERGQILVNDRLETDAPGVYAMGDVKGGPAFTHISYDDYRVLSANLFQGAERSVTDRLVPYAVFTDPQLGRVGLTEEQARRTGRAIAVARIPMTHVARALEIDETRGLMKAVVDRETDRILGCAILGHEGGEVMAALQMAMMGGVTCKQIRDGVFAHPTLAESLNTLFAALES